MSAGTNGGLIVTNGAPFWIIASLSLRVSRILRYGSDGGPSPCWEEKPRNRAGQ